MNNQTIVQSFTPEFLGGIKNRDSVYVAMNNSVARLLGWKNAEACIGKMDYDIPCEAATHAEDFINQDKKFFSFQKKMITLDVQYYTTGWTALITNRDFYNESRDKVLIQSIDITHTVIYQNYLKIYQADKKFLKKNQGASYILNRDFCPLPVTDKQKNCLFFLIRGKTIKQIAFLLKISPRTVEDHVEAIKNKLNCKSKQELIEKVFDSGFLHYIPDMELTLK